MFNSMKSGASRFKGIVESTVHISAPAKLNLFLRIHGRLESGMHSISSLLCPLSLEDSLEIEVSERNSSGQRSDITCHTFFSAKLRKHLLCCSEGEGLLSGLDGEGNLVVRATMAFLEHFGLESRIDVRVRLQKTIPLGAGLGGGSSDAAAIIRGLNRALGLNAPFSVLSQIGARIGSDVPGTMAGGLIFIHGTGNQLTEVESVAEYDTRFLPLGELAVVVVKPLGSVSSKDAYQSLALPVRGPESGISAESQHLLQSFGLLLRASVGDREVLLTSSGQGGISEKLTNVAGSKVELPEFCNDFEPIVRKSYPDVDLAFRFLEKLGALHVMLAGSGSAVLAVCSSFVQAEVLAGRAEQAAPQGWFVTPARLMPGAD